MPPFFLFCSLLPDEELAGEDKETFSDEIVEAAVGEVVQTVRCTFEEEHGNGEAAVQHLAQSRISWLAPFTNQLLASLHG